MTTDNVKALVAYRLEQAEESLQAARICRLGCYKFLTRRSNWFAS
jgi:hypothetical protein